jgi:hypothetical protein
VNFRGAYIRCSRRPAPQKSPLSRRSLPRRRATPKCAPLPSPNLPRYPDFLCTESSSSSPRFVRRFVPILMLSGHELGYQADEEARTPQADEGPPRSPPYPTYYDWAKSGLLSFSFSLSLCVCISLYLSDFPSFTLRRSNNSGW